MTCDRSVVFFGSCTNKTDRHDITEILLKVALNSIKQTNVKNGTLMVHSKHDLYYGFVKKAKKQETIG
jgi:hypothetical protein